MTLKKETLEYYDYWDVRRYLCKQMGIDEKYFRDYHEVVGGEYKDCWHALLYNFEHSMKGNDSFWKWWIEYVPVTEDDMYHWESMLKEYPWAEPLAKALNKFFIEEVKDDSVVLWISW